MKYKKIRKQVLDAIMDAVKMGLINGTSGNIAVRDPESGVIAITPSGIEYLSMKVKDIAIVDESGKWIEGPYKPSSETPMHTAILRARQDVNATVHTHGMFATIMAMTGEVMAPCTPPQAEFTPVRIVPFIMPGTDELASGVVNTLGDGRAVLLENHGMMCVGKNIEAAMAAAVYTEEMAKMTYSSKSLGCYQPLPKDVEEAMQALIAADKAV